MAINKEFYYICFNLHRVCIMIWNSVKILSVSRLESWRIPFRTRFHLYGERKRIIYDYENIFSSLWKHISMLLMIFLVYDTVNIFHSQFVVYLKHLSIHIEREWENEWRFTNKQCIEPISKDLLNPSNGLKIVWVCFSKMCTLYSWNHFAVCIYFVVYILQVTLR